MFVLACAEFPVPTHPVHKRAAKTFQAVEAQAQGLAKAAGVADPEGFARTYVMLIEGALTRRLVGGDNGAARAAREIVARMLDAEERAAGKAPSSARAGDPGG
jgi:hypothetical protein